MNDTALDRGSVIRYSYLWSREEELGRIEGLKDRPSLVIAISVRDEDGETRVFVCAVTHAAPKDRSQAVEMPAAIKRRLGLDEEPSWIVTTEVNDFIWPGPDVRPVPGRPLGTLIYGKVPDELLSRVIASFLDNQKKRRVSIVKRES